MYTKIKDNVLLFLFFNFIPLFDFCTYKSEKIDSLWVIFFIIFTYLLDYHTNEYHKDLLLNSQLNIKIMNGYVMKIYSSKNCAISVLYSLFFKSFRNKTFDLFWHSQTIKPNLSLWVFKVGLFFHRVMNNAI